MNLSNPLADDSAEACQQSYAAALRLLARREHSVLELRHKLTGRHFTDSIVDTVVMQLVEQLYHNNINNGVGEAPPDKLVTQLKLTVFAARQKP